MPKVLGLARIFDRTRTFDVPLRPPALRGKFDRLCGGVIVCFVSGCATAPPSSYPLPGGYAPQAYAPPAYAPQATHGRRITSVNLSSLPQTIGIEHEDRVNRFGRLATLYRLDRPEITQLQLPAGAVAGVGSWRIFPEQAGRCGSEISRRAVQTFR